MPAASCGLSLALVWCSWHSSVVSSIVGPLLTCGTVGPIYSSLCPFLKCPIQSRAVIVPFAANREAGGKIHVRSSCPVQFSKVEASAGPDKWESPMGAGVPRPGG